MKRLSCKIKKASLSLLLGVGAGLLLTACADWNDHFDADTAILNTQQSTLWENINTNGQLKQFASLLKKVGYDEVLNTSQTYTVWAPADGSYNYDALNALSKERLLKEFVQNHIARNSYVASGATNQRVYVLNEKLMLFSGTGSYAMQGVGISQPNTACRNGIIHTLSSNIPFMANIYESLNTDDGYELDSIGDFFHSYDVKKLNEQKSTPGPTLNGQRTYLDSVFDEHNDLFLRYDAYIHREDSNYTMIVPTNKAWESARQTMLGLFNYAPSFEFMENTSNNDPKKVKVTLKDVKYLQDSIINNLLVGDLFYNNNLYDNKKLGNLQTGQTLRCDSLYSTSRSKIFSEDAARLFEGAQRVEKSNGAVWITDSLRSRTWTTWNPEIIVQAENRSTLSSTVNVANDIPETVYITPGTQNPDVPGHVSNNSYIEVVPISSSTNPGVVFYLPEVRSTTYSIYLVLVPANIVSANFETKPNRFKVTMGHAEADGKNQDKATDWLVESTFTSDSSKVDSIFLGDFTFPVAYAGTGDYYPYLRINSAVSSRERANYDRTLRIDCIILRPKELDTYIKEHPDYKYDNDDDRN